MESIVRFFTERAWSKTSFAVGLNLLVIGAVLAVRYSTSVAIQRPVLNLPRTTNFSLANWFAERLADLVALIFDVLRHLH